MKKLLLALLALTLIPTAVFALDFHVDMPHLIDAPNLRYGPEATNTTIYNMASARRQINAQAVNYKAQMQDVTDKLQAQADENSKRLAQTVANNALEQLELDLRQKAVASGDKIEIKSDSMQWQLTYIRTAPSKATRTDIATVDFTTSKCRVVTKVAPYGISVFSVSQIIRH